MRFFISMLMVLAFALPASAEPNVKQLVPLANISAASAAVKTSSAINAVKFRHKTLAVTGVVLTGTAYKNMSGTIIAQCAPTENGPWSTCVANDYAQTAISRTTDGSFTWADVSSYIRLQWTAGTVETKIKAWLNLSE